jgi:predicted metal-dependent HD superfamily phosphohydrolase
VPDHLPADAAGAAWTAAAGAAWTAAVEALGGDPEPARAAAAELTARYAEPHRSYHTGRHVAAVLRDTSLLADALAIDARERHLLVLAACAHDVVYDARPGDDERASAEWARTHLDGVAGADRDRVADLVLATLTHTAPAGDLGAAVLLDADLAILAAGPEDYAHYVRAVRKEYSAVTDDQWRTGRAQVLTDFAARADLFVTAPARSWWDGTAR